VPLWAAPEGSEWVRLLERLGVPYL
jgi:hypothetical protein